MTAQRIPGPIGAGGGQFQFSTGVTRCGCQPGHSGRQHIYADANGSAGQAPAKKMTALIIVGAGQGGVKNGRSDAQLDKVLQQELGKYVTNYQITLKHVASAREMTDAITNGSWDAIFYFGHGVLTRDQMLAPSGTHDDPNAFLKPDDLIAALQRAKPGKVFLLGCESAQTGLARHVSKELKGASVYGMSKDDLDVTWETHNDGKTTTDRLTLSEEPKEYVDGHYVVGGKTPDRRPPEMNDAIDSSGGPGGVFDDSVPNN
jgi:hypothetical protein